MEFFTYALAKLGSSAARLDPKKQGRCMAEVFGAFGWHEGLREMKWIADHMLVRGINWFTPHAFSMAPFPDWDCPPHFYAHGNNPQWPHFGQLMRYMNRTATLLSEGAAARPVAILYHADAEWAGNAMPVERVAAELTRAQIDFDFVPAEAFEDEGRYEVSIADGMLAVNGCRYQAFVMPGASFIGAATAEEVRRMMAAGVTVLAADEVPGALYDADGAADLDGLTATPLADVADALADAGLHESCVVVLEASGAIEPADCTDTSTRATLALDISHPWTVALSPAGSDGTFGEPQKLKQLCALTAEQFAGICGTFHYRTSFELTDDLAHTAIDLGDVYEVATLTLDGQTLGTRICPPYRFATGALAAGTHELTIDVINTLDHAIPDIFALTEPVAPSGVLGPVTLLGQNLPK
ncbi:MAG: hypothetical protein KH246_09455 [Collinsella sp.]|nr:hypothetical protein [Collinsella sp.]